MRKTINSLIKNALIVLALGIFLVCIIPHRSNTVAHMVLFPLEKKIQAKIEFGSSRIWLPGNISLSDISLIDESGRLYYSKTANINYNLFDILFKNKAFSFDLEKVKFYTDIDLLNSVTDMLVISKIPDVEFKKIEGILELRKDGIYVKDTYAYSNSLRIKGGGWIDKNGSLDCNVNFSFYKDITDKVPDIVKIALLTPEDGEWMGISFEVYGNYKKPSLHIKGERLKLNIMEGILRHEE